MLILLLAAGLLSTGVGKLQALGVLPMSAALWDTSWLLSDRSGIGSFLSGLVGYRARPSGAEVAAYAVYVLAMGTLLFRPLPRAGWAMSGRPAKAEPAVVHDEQHRLRIARAGKLILTK